MVGCRVLPRSARLRQLRRFSAPMSVTAYGTDLHRKTRPWLLNGTARSMTRNMAP